MTACQPVAPEGGWPMQGEARLEGSAIGGRLVIRPAHPYLDLLDSGAEFEPPASGFFYWPLRSPAARLDIKLVNNSPGTVVAHLVRLDVRRSVARVHLVPYTVGGRVVLDPWPRVRDPVRFEPDERPDATLSFHLELPGDGRAVSSEYVWDYHADFGPRNAEHPLVLALSEAGAYPVADMELARRRYESLTESGVVPADPPKPPWRPFHDHVWQPGPFNGDRAVMAGRITYTETGLDVHRAETKATYTYPFRTTIDLKVAYLTGPRPNTIEAYYVEPSAVYPGPILSGSGENYAIEIPISHSLPSGEADRLLIPLEAGVPSTHDFRVTVLSTVGEVECGLVHLETYRTIDRKYRV